MLLAQVAGRKRANAMGRKARIGTLSVGAIYRRAKHSRMWIKIDDRQHATAVYNSITESWEMGWLPGSDLILEDFNPNEEVEMR